MVKYTPVKDVLKQSILLQNLFVLMGINFQLMEDTSCHDKYALIILYNWRIIAKCIRR